LNEAAGAALNYVAELEYQQFSCAGRRHVSNEVRINNDSGQQHPEISKGRCRGDFLQFRHPWTKTNKAPLTGLDA
jgi:hypothetical protein